MNHVTAMTEEVRLPRVSQVVNLSHIVTASPLDLNGTSMAERYVITHTPAAITPFSVYKELLSWSGHRWLWEHDKFVDGAYRANYKDAMRNLDFRLRGLQK